MLDARALTFETIVDRLVEGVLVNGPDGQVQYVNQALADMLRYDRQGMIGCTIFDWMDEAGRRVARHKLGERRTGAIDRFDFGFLRGDGTKLWARVSARPLFDEGRFRGSLVCITDISDHIALEDALEATNRRAAAASEAKSRFLANMSHELRTPLNAIIGYTEMIVEDPEVPVAEALRDLDRVQQSAVHLLELIDDVLDLSSIEAGTLSVEPDDIDLRATLAGCVEWLCARNQRRSIAVDLEDLPGHFEGDARRIRQVVLNLVGNALKYGQGCIRVAARVQDGFLVVDVSDEGPGIDPSRHEAIFDTFQRGDRETNRRVGGTGLGLSISRLIARRLGGDLTVASAVGHGSTFTFTLPELP